jgi:hypothetical protein
MLVLNANTLFYWELTCRAKAKPFGLVKEWSRAVEDAEKQGKRLAQSRKSGPSSTQPSVSRTLVSVPLVSKDYKWKGGKPQEASSKFKAIDISDEEWPIKIKEEPAPTLQSLASLRSIF